jgi:L-arabinokinase
MLAFYISGHGFGHASRDVETINALRSLRPDVGVLVRTAAPRWLFDLTLTAPVDLQHVECDTGIVQIDSLHLDADATIDRADAFHATLDERAAAEARVLGDAGVSLVVGDIPPLAMAAAARADVPGIALGNFTWDWIYAAYPDSLARAPRLLERIRRAYREATLALRLPMFGGFDVFAPRIRDVPFIARRSRFDRAEARRQFSIPPNARAVLISFGGYGLRSLDPALLTRMPEYTFLLTADPQEPRRDDEGAANRLAATSANVITFDERVIYERGLRYEDLVTAADIVVTKPGYGIVAECIANGTAMLYTSRGHFVEYDVFVSAMPRYLRCRFIPHEDLFGGNWQPHLDRLLREPAPPERPRTDGADVVAAIVADYL